MNSIISNINVLEYNKFFPKEYNKFLEDKSVFNFENKLLNNLNKNNEYKNFDIFEYVDINIYKMFYIDNIKFYKNNYLTIEDLKVIVICYLNKFHCGWTGIIHGGSSYMLTYICISAYLAILNSQYHHVKLKIKNHTTKYIKKIFINSNLIVSLEYLKDNINSSIKVFIKDEKNVVYLISTFVLHKEDIINTDYNISLDIEKKNKTSLNPKF